MCEEKHVTSAGWQASQGFDAGIILVAVQFEIEEAALDSFARSQIPCHTDFSGNGAGELIVTQRLRQFNVEVAASVRLQSESYH